MSTISKIIDDLGGNAIVATKLGVGASTISECKRRNSLPVKYWPGLLRIAAEADVSISEKDLVSAHFGEAAQ